MHPFGIEIVVEHALVGLAEGTGVDQGEISGTLPAGVQVRPHRGQACTPRLAHEGSPVLGIDPLGEPEGLQALEAAGRLNALNIIAPLLWADRVGGVEQSAGAEHRVEVGFGAALQDLLGGLAALLEAGAVVHLDVLAHVVPGEDRQE